MPFPNKMSWSGWIKCHNILVLQWQQWQHFLFSSWKPIYNIYKNSVQRHLWAISITLPWPFTEAIQCWLHSLPLWAAEGNGTVWTPYLSNFTLSGKISGGKEAQSLQNIKKKNLDVVIWETSAANRASVIINLHFFLWKYWCLLHDTHWKFQLAWQVGYSTGH